METLRKFHVLLAAKFHVGGWFVRDAKPWAVSQRSVVARESGGMLRVAASKGHGLARSIRYTAA